MKNIHILPTDKPSKLWMTKLGNFSRCNDIRPIKKALGNNVNIHITNDEEIKEGDWCLGEENYPTKNWNSIEGFEERYKKIILTTDQDLIKDGVQEMDDEFIEWFVKNPSCEEVEVKLGKILNQGSYITGNIVTKDYYEIIIPQEEPKQETIEEAAEKQWGNVHRTGVLGFIEGAKWQSERMYSEEELQKLFDSYGDNFHAKIIWNDIQNLKK